MGTDIIGYNDMVTGDREVDAVLAAVQGTDIVGYNSLVAGGTMDASRLPLSFIGVPPTTIPASSTGTLIQVTLQRDLRPDRFVVGRAEITAGALVVDIKVGTISLNCSVNSIPADAFAPDAMGTAIRAVVTAVPAVGIQLTIANSTAVAFTMRGAFFGPSAPA